MQRDYWAVIRNSRYTPSEIMSWIALRFPEFSPVDRAVFRRSDEDEGRALEVGSEMEVSIPMAGRFRVRVIHHDAQSLTIGTLFGHPEAGRITFGSYRNPQGDVIFHIRSIARSSRRFFFAGFLVLGEPMQTHTWTDFVNSVALSAGEGVLGYIHAETRKLPPEEERKMESQLKNQQPTFRATGD